MMRRVLLCFLMVTLGAIGSVRADETVRTVQTRLKAGGFYYGEITGQYDSKTAAAVTRYQIRNGLKITGQLDPQTSYALGVTETKPEMPAPKFGEDVWRYLRKSDQEQLKRMIAEDARSNGPEKSLSAKPTKPPPARQPEMPAPAATTETSSSA